MVISKISKQKLDLEGWLNAFLMHPTVKELKVTDYCFLMIQTFFQANAVFHPAALF